MKILKKLSKIVAVSTACVLSASAFAACGSDAPADEAPIITGAGDFDCVVNEPVDLLRRVAALDREDGDITPKMTISISPEVEVKDGVAVFPTTDDYEITYSVKDSKGHTAEATSYVSVYSRTEFKVIETVDMNGFDLKTSGSAKIVTKSVKGDGNITSKLYFEATGAAADGDVSLNRTYSLNCGVDYVFNYTLNSNVAGTAKVKVGENDPVDLTVAQGDNTLSFPLSVPEAETEPAEGEVAKADVTVQLLLGGLGEDIKIEFDKATVSHEVERGTVLFTDTNVHNRFDGTEGNVTVAVDNTAATLEITKTADAIWKGGMFINTGVELVVGGKYDISFTLDSANDGDFEVNVLNSQWGPDEFITGFGELNKKGLNSKSLTVPAGKAGTLWLYVQSGTNVNTITMSDLKVIPRGFETTVSLNNNFNVEPRFDGASGNVWSNVDNSAVTLQVTKAGDGMWRGGMFINTGVPIAVGESYDISFEAQSNEDADFEVCIQCAQWDDANVMHTIEHPVKNGKNEYKLTVPDGKAGTLWLYVRAGANVNEVTISNLKVEQKSETTVQFNQGQNVENRDGKGTLSVNDQGASATFELKEEEKESELWQCGMFINTGVAIGVGNTYDLSFNLHAEE